MTKLSVINFAKQPIWNNNLFQFDSKTMFHKNWIQSGIMYVKDLFNADGQFKTLQELSPTLKQKAYWMFEYKIVRNAKYKKSLIFNMKYKKYTLTIFFLLMVYSVYKTKNVIFFFLRKSIVQKN